MRSQSSQFWRTSIDSDLDLNFRTSDADAANHHVSDQSKPVVKIGPGLRDRINTVTQPSPVPEGRKGPRCVYQNFRGQRVDVPDELNPNPPLTSELRDREQRLCNAHHLLRSCPNEIVLTITFQSWLMTNSSLFCVSLKAYAARLAPPALAFASRATCARTEGNADTATIANSQILTTSTPQLLTDL